MPKPVLEIIRQRNPSEWARIRQRIMVDMDGDEIVRGVRDLAFVAAVKVSRIMDAIRGGDLGVPALVAHRSPLRTNDPGSFFWWCYLDDLMNWRRAYAGKPDGYTTTVDTTSLDPSYNKSTVGPQQVNR